ncbi:MAG: hypothetical protein IRZ03_18475 [Acidobacterium ailaaui]|nr:hypothetical protein [Pseudacidobacterium ailaaui]
MSYITAKGKAAAQNATSEGGARKDYSSHLIRLKSGDRVVVKLPDAESYVEYRAASVFKCFYTAPVVPGDNLYEKASKNLFEKGRQTGDETYTEAARLIRPRARYLFGFINLDDGKPVIFDATRKQAQSLISTIEKYAKKVDKIAFELSKSGESTSTVVTLSPIIDMDEDLNDTQRANFDKAVAEGAKVPDDIFENVLTLRDHAGQVEDLRKFAEKYGLTAEELGVDLGDGGADGEPDPTEAF